MAHVSGGLQPGGLFSPTRRHMELQRSLRSSITPSVARYVQPRWNFCVHEIMRCPQTGGTERLCTDLGEPCSVVSLESPQATRYQEPKLRGFCECAGPGKAPVLGLSKSTPTKTPSPAANAPGTNSVGRRCAARGAQTRLTLPNRMGSKCSDIRHKQLILGSNWPSSFARRPLQHVSSTDIATTLPNSGKTESQPPTR